MKRYIRPLCLLFAATLLSVSCVDDDDEVEVTLYDDIAITDFQITSGTVAGSTDVALTGYAFSIDQLNGRIYNADSLPVGTLPASLVCGYSTMNNGLVYIESLITGERSYLTTTEAVDFSEPRRLYVMSSDGSAERAYTVEVRIHKEQGDEFRWTQLDAEGGCPEIKALTGMRAVALEDRLVVFGQNADGTATMTYHTSLADGRRWTAGRTFGPEAYQNVAVFDKALYVLDGTELMRSDDSGQTFSSVVYGNGAGTLVQLVGAGTAEMYAMTAGGGMAVSEDGGVTWTADAMDDDACAVWMPARDVTFCCTPFSYNDSTDYVVMAGNRSLTDGASANDATAVVWRKIVEYSADSKSGKWTLMNIDGANAYPLPRLSGLTVLGYDGKLLAMGGAGIGTCDLEPFSQLYESRDGGITWKSNASYVLPSAFDRTATAFAAAVDGNNNIWVVCGGTGQVWRGRLNRLGWTND